MVQTPPNHDIFGEKAESKMDPFHAEIIKELNAQPNCLAQAADTVDGVTGILSLT